MSTKQYKLSSFDGRDVIIFNDIEEAYKHYILTMNLAYFEVIEDNYVTYQFNNCHDVEEYKNRNSDYYDLKLSDYVGRKLVDTNLKTAAAQNKPKLSDVPPVALFALGAAMSDGASKYGRYNWRDTGSTASVFYDAMMRHLTDWYNGEDYADDSKVHHLGHIMASCAILLDSELNNKLNDDRDKRKPDSISRNPQNWKKMT